MTDTPDRRRLDRDGTASRGYNISVSRSADVRGPLLALHKAVLGAERRNVERVHGALSGAEYLQIVSDPVRYGWLVPLTELVLAYDEDGDEAPSEQELLERTRELLLPPKASTPFGRRYLSLMQRAPDLVMAHSALAKRL
jgi:hypothetical protein